MTTKTAVWEIATENHKNCPGASEKGTVLTMLMQALHLADDGAELFGVRVSHIILLICTHTRTKTLPPNQTQSTTEPRSEPMPRVSRGNARPTAD